MQKMHYMCGAWERRLPKLAIFTRHVEELNLNLCDLMGEEAGSRTKLPMDDLCGWKRE